MHTASPPNRLRELREARDVSRIAVAAACDVDTSTIARWEKGTTPLPQDQYATVARLLDVAVPYLIGWSTTEEPFSDPREKAA